RSWSIAGTAVPAATGCDPACNPGGSSGISPAAIRTADASGDAPQTCSLRRGERHGNTDFHPAADGLMKSRFLRIPFILTVLGAAVAFTARGEWPWARLSSVPTALPIVVSDPYQIVRDTLQSGENLS